MKRVRNIVLIALAAVFAAGCIGWYFLTHDTAQPKRTEPATFIDNSGQAHNVVVDTDGVTFAAVADDQGNVWQVEINPDGSLGATIATINEYVDISDIVTASQGDRISESVDPNAFTGEAQTVPSTEGALSTSESTTLPAESEKSTTAPTTTQPESSTAPAPSKLNFERYRELYSGGTYYMVFSTNDEALGSEPISSAKKGGNILVTTTIEGMTGTVIYQADKDKTYFVVDEWKRYFSIPKSLMGEEINMSELDLLSGFFSPEMDASRFKSETVEINGRKLVCESYKADSGAERKYYFDGGTLVRIDSVDENGESSEFYISSVTNEVPDSLFEIPAGYRYLNLSWLG